MQIAQAIESPGLRCGDSSASFVVATNISILLNSGVKVAVFGLSTARTAHELT